MWMNSHHFLFLIKTSLASESLLSRPLFFLCRAFVSSVSLCLSSVPWSCICTVYCFVYANVFRSIYNLLSLSHAWPNHAMLFYLGELVKCALLYLRRPVRFELLHLRCALPAPARVFSSSHRCEVIIWTRNVIYLRLLPCRTSMSVVVVVDF